MALVIDRATRLELSAEQVRDWGHDQRVFVSSTIADMTTQRQAAKQGIEAVGAEALMWEGIAPTPGPPDQAYLDGVRRSQYYLLLLRSRYGAKRLSGYSATHEEYNEAQRLHLPVLIWIEQGVASDERDGPLNDWIRDLQTVHSTGTYSDAKELEGSVMKSLHGIALDAETQWAKLGDAALPVKEFKHRRKDAWSTASSLEVQFRTRDRNVQRELEAMLTQRMSTLTIGARSYSVTLDGFEKHTEGSTTAYACQFSATEPQRHFLVGCALAMGGKQMTPAESVRELVVASLGGPLDPVLQGMGQRAPTLNLAEVLSSDLAWSRKAKVLSLLVTEGLCGAGLLETCECESRPSGAGALITVRGTVAGGWGGTKAQLVEVGPMAV